MENIKKFSRVVVLTVLVIFFVGVSATAGETTTDVRINPIADITIGANGIGWTPKVSYARLELTVSGPDGIVISKSFDAGATPYLGLGDNNGKYFTDGSYTYELRVIPTLAKRVRSDVESGEGIPREEPLVQSGYFTILGGGFVIPKTGPEGLAKPLDQIILDDLIVDGSLCVGQDCVNGESFGFDTIRLKENNLRIRFVDTSNSASFPTRDWQITVNESSNGGANKFSIDDIDGGRTPFTIEASAPSHSIYVDDGGRVGFGTSTPVADLHVENGNTPTLRLEQDGSSGFTAQTWDVSGNEANFFIRDATNGSTLPLRIRPGAQTSSIDIEADDDINFVNGKIYFKSDGNVGIGTSSPGWSVEVERTGENAAFVVDRTDGATCYINSTDAAGNFGTTTDHPVRIITSGTTVMTVNETGNYLDMIGGGYYNGTWNPSSSREVKENIKNLDVEDAMGALNELNPVRYNYIFSKDEARVGFIAEDVPDIVALNGRKSLGTMDIMAVLTKVVQEQQKSIQQQQKVIAELNKRITELEKK
jgi:hypothetical protein